MPVRSALCRRTLPPAPAPSPSPTLPPPPGISIQIQCITHSGPHSHHRPRCLSSHLGPLESRRRLGKRNMAGLMPATPCTPPPWHFNVASIPNAWYWEAPTSQHERRTRRERVSLAGLFNRLIRWLEKSDADRPFLQPPPALDVDTAAGDRDAMEDTVDASVLPQQADYPDDFPVEVLRLRTRIALAEKLDDEALHVLCRTCRRSLQRRVIRRQLSTEGLYHALEPFDQPTLSRIGDQDGQLAGKFAAMIRRTLLAEMIRVQREDPGAPFEPLWLAFAEWICASDCGHSNMQLFWRLMQGIPDSVRDRIPSERILRLARSFITAQANRHNVFRHWVSRAQNFSEIYGGLGAAQRSKLEAGVLAFLELHSEEHKEHENSRLRFAWLAVQAFDQRTSDEAFLNSYRLICGQSQSKPGLQLWQLILGRAYSSGAISDESLSQLLSTEKSSMRDRWAALIQAILASPGASAQMQTICQLLQSMGELDSVAHAFLSSRGPFVQLDCVRALVTASHDHRFALRLHSALEAKGIHKPLLRKHFPWDVWAPYVEAMIQDAELDPLPITRLLGLTTLAPKEDPASRDEVVAKVELLDRMGGWYMQTRHLNERQLLRRIGECAAIQRSLMDSVSGQTLANLARVIVRDLDGGRWGRTTRLEWLVRLVGEVQGEKEAMRTARVLRGWRSMIDRGKQ